MFFKDKHDCPNLLEILSFDILNIQVQYLFLLCNFLDSCYATNTPELSKTVRLRSFSKSFFFSVVYMFMRDSVYAIMHAHIYNELQMHIYLHAH